MPAVQCPKCQRRLRLPEEVIGKEARCPLCGASFPAEPEGGLPVPVGGSARDVPDPSQPWRPPGASGRRTEEGAPGDRFPRSMQSADPERDRLASAGSWLFGLSLAALLWDLTCGCGGLALAMDGLGRDGSPSEFLGIAFAAAHLAHMAVVVVLLITGHAMRQARSPGLCRVGVWLALAEPVFLAVRLGLLGQSGGGRDLGPGLLLVSAAVPVVLFFAGLAAAGVLSRRGVQEVLARSAPPARYDE